MRNGLIAGAALVIVVFVLVGAGLNTGTGLPTLNDLPLAQAFNGRFEVSATKPLQFTLPNHAGFVVTYFSVNDTSYKFTIRIKRSCCSRR